ncbi:hypothetical protein L0F63_005620, partial [Massospora cicadina]
PLLAPHLPLYTLHRRTENKWKEQAQACSSECTMQVCERRCYLRHAFEYENRNKLTLCYTNCALDPFCGYTCFYKAVGLTKEEIWKQYNTNKVKKYCKTTPDPDKCLAEALDIPEQSVIENIACLDSKCSENTSMLNISLCELDCQADIIEPLLRSNATLVINRHKKSNCSSKPELFKFVALILIFLI